MRSSSPECCRAKSVFHFFLFKNSPAVESTMEMLTKRNNNKHSMGVNSRKTKMHLPD